MATFYKFYDKLLKCGTEVSTAVTGGVLFFFRCNASIRLNEVTPHETLSKIEL